jgi:hypothetical protein
LAFDAPFLERWWDESFDLDQKMDEERAHRVARFHEAPIHADARFLQITRRRQCDTRSGCRSLEPASLREFYKSSQSDPRTAGIAIRVAADGLVRGD